MPANYRLNCDEKTLIDFLLHNISSQRINEIDQNYTGPVDPPILNYWAPANILSDFQVLTACRDLIGGNATLKDCDTFVQLLIVKLVKIVIPDGLIWDRLITYFEESNTQAIGNAINQCIQQIRKKTRFYIPICATTEFYWSGQNFSIIGADKFLAQSNHDLSNFDCLTEDNAFLEIDARDIEQARDIEEIVLGAFALAMYPTDRYQIKPSNQHACWFMNNGGFQRANRYNTHMPSVETFEFTEADSDWLVHLDEIVFEREREPKKSNALQLVFNSWHVSKLQRFALLCASVEALIPETCKKYDEKCDWIKNKLNDQYSEDAIELLFKKMRLEVAHGDIANLEQSDHHLKFIEHFKMDPSSAQEQLVMRVLETEIFKGVLRYQGHPLTKQKSDKTAYENYVRIFGMPEQYASHPISDLLLA